jgi:hypothetical protein
MKQFETNNDVLVNTRPLFSSTWLALFTGLREHYRNRQVVVSTRPDTNNKKQSGVNLRKL